MGTIERRMVTSGFFLVEVLIALVVFGSIASTIAYYQWHISCWQREIKLYNKAINKARFIVDVLINNHENVAYDTEHNLFTITHDEKNIHIKEMPLSKQYNLIIVTVFWKTPTNQSRSYQLISGTS
ncbi:hypothetical protein KC460_00960 [Candidatus Dependentiae bacterium]|nr:hypothetical protein [Candidatus Dependentiae bacterium]